MVDDVPLRMAVETAWSLYLASNRDVDTADNRRFLLERHPHKRWETDASKAEELAFELTCLARLPEGEG